MGAPTIIFILVLLLFISLYANYHLWNSRDEIRQLCKQEREHSIELLIKKYISAYWSPPSAVPNGTEPLSL